VSALECEAIIYVAIAPVNSLGSASLSTVSPTSFIYTTTGKKTTCKPSDSFDSSSAAMSGDTITVTIAGGKDGNSPITSFTVSHGSGDAEVTCTATFVSVTEFTLSYSACMSSTPGSYTLKMYTGNLVGTSEDLNTLDVEIYAPTWTTASAFDSFWSTDAAINAGFN